MKKNFMIFGVLLVILSMALTFCARSSKQEVRSVSKEQNKEETRIVSFKMRSECVKDEYVIDVSFPSNYDKTIQYPVVYLTDGYWRKGEHERIHVMSQQGEIKEVIVVGICYPEGYNVGKFRVRDFLGGAEAFLSFIVEELVPYIDQCYPTEVSDRTLFGASHGGYFTNYSLLRYQDKTKDIFKNYIFASPTLWNRTDGMDLYEREEELYSVTQTLPVHVYMTVGKLEDGYIALFNKMVEALSSPVYQELELKHLIDSGKNHDTVWQPTLMEGLRMFLAAE